MKLLAGDLGGTKTLLCLAECAEVGGKPRVLHEQRLSSGEFPDFESLLRAFLRGAGEQSAELQGLCLAVAGPVEILADGHRRSRITNLPWEVNTASLQADLHCPATLLNDFESVGHGLAALEPGDLAPLQPGRPVPGGTRLLLGAGTGLGQALLVSGEWGYQVLPTEGGHAGFAPEDAEQVALLTWLRRHLARVTWEHILSGAGLTRIFDFLCERLNQAPGAALETAMQREDPAAAISRFALEDNDPLALAALDLFIKLYGSQAGNLALGCLATGGVFIAGGIAPKILPQLQEGGFVRAFLDKSPMRHLLENMPVTVVTNERVGLLGAVLTASRL